jgi:hypothetical protein
MESAPDRFAFGALKAEGKGDFLAYLLALLITAR